MVAPWPLGVIAVGTSLLDSLGLHPGDPVSESFLVHLGIRFGTHFCSLLEAVSGLILELIWSVERIPERTKDTDGILEDPYPNLESFRCTLLR